MQNVVLPFCVVRCYTVYGRRFLVRATLSVSRKEGSDRDVQVLVSLVSQSALLRSQPGWSEVQFRKRIHSTPSLS